MNAPPFPANPSFGQYFGNWVWSGSRWVCTNANGVRVVTQVFRASAPYTPSPGLVSLVVETFGAGGAGGWAAGDAMTTGSGGGGGSGGYSRVTLASGLVLGGVNVTVAPATPNTPNTVPPGYGLSGGATSFGAFCLANGGTGGQGNNSSNVHGDGGAGAPLGVGDVTFSGSPGVAGTTSTLSVNAGATTITVVVGGAGGSMWGGGGQAVLCPPTFSLPGFDATDPAGGGSGGSVNTLSATPDGTQQLGGTGGGGMCIVTEYCWADAIDDGCGCGPTGGARVAIPAGPQGRGGWGYNEDGE